MPDAPAPHPIPPEPDRVSGRLKVIIAAAFGWIILTEGLSIVRNGSSFFRPFTARQRPSTWVVHPQPPALLTGTEGIPSQEIASSIQRHRVSGGSKAAPRMVFNAAKL